MASAPPNPSVHTRICTLSSLPQTTDKRSKYKEGPVKYGNVTYDRRVFRGDTSTQHRKPNTARPDSAEMQIHIRRRAVALKRAQEQSRPKTPEAVQGRAHCEVQTDVYLEELSNIIMTTDIDNQTDAFLDRPASPLFIPAKSGEDVATQIEIGELFDFDREVQPMLEVLVGKTVEQSLLEVMEEEELACLKSQQRAFQQIRNVRLAEVQRFREQERRHKEEKDRRIAERKVVLQKMREAAEEKAAEENKQRYLSELLTAAFNSLRNHGYFQSPVERDIEKNCIPWLMDEVNKGLERRLAVRQLLDNVIHDVAQKRLVGYKNLENQPEEESEE